MKIVSKLGAICAGTVVALLIIVGVPLVAHYTLDAVWDEDYRIVSQTPGQIVLHVYGYKPAFWDLSLAERPEIDENGRIVMVPVQPTGWAVGADGHRRKLALEPYEGNQAEDYPPGRSDFGRWEFFDPRAPDGPPIVALEMVIRQVGPFGERNEVLGPFPIR